MKLTRIISLVVMMTAGLIAPLGAAAADPARPSDPLAQVGTDVCVAIPVLPGLATSKDCPTGIIPSNRPGGPIVFYLIELLKLANLAVGAIIVLMIVIAGIQYMLSAGDPTNVKNAKKRITNALIGLVLYLFMGAILNFLVPGGLLNA